MSLEMLAFSAPPESANGMEAHPTTVDAAMIKNAPPRIQADCVLSTIGIPNSFPYLNLAPLYAIVQLEVKLIRRRLRNLPGQARSLRVPAPLTVLPLHPCSGARPCPSFGRSDATLSRVREAFGLTANAM